MQWHLVMRNEVKFMHRCLNEDDIDSYDWVFLLLPEMWQKLRMQIFFGPDKCPEWKSFLLDSL
jgi:hypothetical protein